MTDKLPFYATFTTDKLWQLILHHSAQCRIIAEELARRYNVPRETETELRAIINRVKQEQGK